MIVYSFALITLIVSITGLYLLMRNTRKGPAGWHGILLSLCLGCFVYLYGAWVFLSIYLKIVLVACYAAVFIIAFLTRHSCIPNKKGRRGVAVNLVCSALLLTLCILYFTGTTGKPDTVDLILPFKQGRYYVFQGGKGLPTNLFHFSLRKAVYAMDIVKLNKYGNRSKKIFSNKLSDYEIFGDTIYSPCSGRIIRAVDDHPDNIPPHWVKGLSKLNGIVIATDSYTVFMGHLEQQSLQVHVNDMVVAGQPLACAGNSGFTIEPHLHIQVHKKTHSALPWYKEPQLYIRFNGRSYLLFQVIRP